MSFETPATGQESNQEIAEKQRAIQEKLFELGDDTIRPLPDNFPNKDALLGLISAAARLADATDTELGTPETRKNWIKGELYNALAPLGLAVEDREKLLAMQQKALFEHHQEDGEAQS